MGDGVITTYTLRAASAGELHASLVAASVGKARPYAWGEVRFDEARVRLPYPELVATGTDPESYEPTGYWLCDVSLVDSADDDLAALSGN